MKFKKWGTSGVKKTISGWLGSDKDNMSLILLYKEVAIPWNLATCKDIA